MNLDDFDGVYWTSFLPLHGFNELQNNLQKQVILLESQYHRPPYILELDFIFI